MNWFNIKLHVLLVLLVSWHSLTEARDSDEENVPREQKVDSAETDVKEIARGNTPPNIVHQIFSQPALRPSLTYHPGQSINYNIGYNLGRSIGKTPFLGAPLDSKADASKVVLVLANDTPKTSNLPQPDSETLKRLVRTPDFWNTFASQMASFNQQLSEQVPAMSRTFGAGINEFISQTPILGDAQQTSPINFADLGQTFGERILAPNLFPTPGNGGSPDDSNSGNAENESTPSPQSETERVENELSSNVANPLLSNPLFRGLQSFVPQGFPTPPPLRNMFNAAPTWPWVGLNQEGAASDISEVRVRPGAENTYKIYPQEVIAPKIAEMKLRAAMKDALDKKTIPILWFSLPANNGKQSTGDNTRQSKTHTPVSEEDLIMRSKLEAFEKQLIAELKQLQEVVKLANAMKKAQLEAKGVKFDVTDIISPLALNTTPIYKITLADIEKTLKDEYVRKLLQMIYNSQPKNMQGNVGSHESGNTKYSTDLMGSPSKRQASSASEAMAHLNKDDMMKMMAYAYRMAAANGEEVPWQKEDNAKGMSVQQQSAQRQWVDSQSHMQNQFGLMMQEQAKQRQWLESNAQMKQQPFQQTMPQQAEQRQWLESNGQMNQAQMPMHMRQFMPMNTELQMPQQSPKDANNPNMQAMQQQRQIGLNMNMRQSTSPAESSQAQFQAQSAIEQQQRQIGLNMNMMQSAGPTESNQPQVQTQSANEQQQRQFGPNPAQFQTQTANEQQPRQHGVNMNMRPSTGPAETNPTQFQTQTANERQMFQNSQFQMNVQQDRQMGMGGGKQQTQMANTDMQSQSQDTVSPMQRQLADNQADLQPNGQQTGVQMPKADERQMKANNGPGMQISNEATPQMPENAGKERHKDLDDLLDDFGLFGKKKHNNQGSTINYYYNAGGSRYPPIYASPGGYSAGYGGYAPPPSYAYGGGRPSSYGGYAKPPPSSSKYAPQSGYYGGGGYGSNAYGTRGGYRTATGDDEIEEMLRQHQTLPHSSSFAPVDALALPSMPTYSICPSIHHPKYNNNR